MRSPTWPLALLIAAGASVAAAQTPAAPQTPADVAALNAEAKKVSDVDAERSIEMARQALAAARHIHDRAGEAEALHNVAVGYLNQGVLNLAAEIARESAEAYASVGDARGESQGYNTLGLIAADAADFAEALEHHLRALAIRERAGDKAGLSYSLNNLGNVYRNTGDFAKALEHHERSLAIKLELGDRLSEAFSHHNIGLVYFEMGDHARALEAFRRGLAIREAAADLRQAGASLNAIGQVEAQSNPQAALATYARALAIRRQVGDVRGEAATEFNIGEVHRSLGTIGAAMAAFERALALTGDADALLLRSNILRAMADVEEARGNAAAALTRHRAYVEVRDRLFNQQNAERVQRLQAAYEAERRDQQIQALEQAAVLHASDLARVRSTQTGLAVAVVLTGVSLTLLYARYRLKQRSEARLKAQAAELSEALDRVKTLKGLLPICSSCKKIRDDNGYWTQVEAYVTAHSSAEFTHGFCPTCFDVWYPELKDARAGAPADA